MEEDLLAPLFEVLRVDRGVVEVGVLDGELDEAPDLFLGLVGTKDNFLVERLPVHFVAEVVGEDEHLLHGHAHARLLAHQGEGLGRELGLFPRLTLLRLVVHPPKVVALVLNTHALVNDLGLLEVAVTA